jgi:hypothetical protein
VATLRLGLRVIIGPRQKGTCPGCSVPLTTRTRSSPSLSEPASSRNMAETATMGFTPSALSTLV